MNKNKSRNKNNKIKLKTAAAVFAFAISSSMTCSILAAQFKDIPETYWAYSSIESIASKNLITGDSDGKFNPDDYIDKFTVSRIMAKVLGYDYNGATQAEKDNIDSIYNSYKTYLDQVAATYSKWNKNTDKEIAYLLSKNFLTKDDISKFILVTNNSTEKLRAMTREETADFLVRLLGKRTEAESYKNKKEFSDDASITDDKKGSVYYLKSIGIISGATTGKYNPKAGISKAEFCVLLDKVITTLNNEKTNTNTPPSNTEVNNVSSINGVVDKYYSSMNVLQTTVGGETKLYKIYPEAEIKINGAASSISYLSTGMTFSAVLNNSIIIKLEATGAQNQTPNIDTNISNNDNNNNNNNNTSEANPNTTTNSPDINNNNNNSVPSIADIKTSEDRTAKGNISYILINGSKCLIGITDGTETKYFNVDTENVPIYALKAGDSVEVSANKGIIESLKLRDILSSDIKTGFIENKRSEYITFNDDTDPSESIKLYFDEENTKFMDSTNGKEIDANELESGMRVYLIMESASSSDIKSVIVIG